MCFLIFFVCSTKKIIQQKKICPTVEVFYQLDQNLCGPHTFEKKKVIVLGENKIISGEISVIELIQMNFNRR